MRVTADDVNFVMNPERVYIQYRRNKRKKSPTKSCALTARELSD